MDNTIINLKSLLLNAYDHLKKKNYNKGKILLEKINSINPNIFEVNYNLAIINSQLSNFDTAISYFNKAKKINPNVVSLYNNLGVAYENNQDIDLALKTYKKAIDVDSKNSLAFFNLGTLYKKNNIIEKAEYNLIKSIDLDPNFFPSYNNLFDLYDRSNQIEKYSELLKKALNFFKDNNITNLYSGIHEYKKKNYQNSIKFLENINFDKKEYKKNIHRYGVLAKCYDQLKKYNKAFYYFSINNNSVNEYYGHGINEKNYIKYVKQRIDFFENFNVKKWKLNLENNKISDPIFLIGFPRSGTTLLDTILRTNKSVEVLEEKPIIKNFLIKLEQKTKNNFNHLENLDENYVKEMQKFYFSERSKFLDNKKANIVIDKLPLNIVHVGEIVRFFPKAKFIFALRHPYDSVLSCFMQHFTLNPAMKNFLNIETSGYLYDLVMRLWVIYRKNFELNFHIIKYENIVLDFEKTTKNIFKFINIPWSDDIKNFHLTAKKRIDISTPSYNQVTSPLYINSINRWKNYEEKLKCLKVYLDQWVKYFDYKF